MRIMILLFMAALLASTQLAYAIPSGNEVIDCSALFSGTATGGSLGAASLNPAQWGGVLGLGLLVITTILTLMGMLYAIGTAFGIEKLTTFVKSEIFESFMNLIILVVILSGIDLFQPAIIFLASVGSIFNTGAAITGAQNAANLASTGNLYQSICSSLQSYIIVQSIENWLGVFVGLFINQVITSFSIAFAPEGFGVGVHPLWGYTAHQEVFWLEQTSFLVGMEFGIFVIITLFIIYALFPIFLYAGIVLRSFPWTRAAGGSFIALFIAFYIVFPALVYPFTVAYTPSSYICSPTSRTYATSHGGLCDTHTFLSVATFTDILSPLTTPLGQVAFYNMVDYVQAMAYIGLQLIGFIIALLISYDIVEQLASILGAPSVQGRRIFSRVV
ncbi:MAG: hypothetical protein KGH72_01805 [Candidatus Micrarchaeota archaeon]|nr:hypothetical protein [Candidatus Micrarchaeota archaeon]